MKKKFLLTILTVSISLSSSNLLKAQCHINDWSALKALYENTGGDNWTDRSGWDWMIDNRSTQPANCDLSLLHKIELGLDGRVSKVLLYVNNLTGTLPTELENLASLKVLALYGNQITGSIPSEIGNLTNLKELHLVGNKLTGKIPPEIANLQNLSRLFLNSNQLSGNIPNQIMCMQALDTLILSDNQFTGGIPLCSNTNFQSNLTELLLHNNKLSGSIPNDINKLSKLKKLLLSNNQLTGTIPKEIADLTDLFRLYIANNLLSGSIPPEIGYMPSLKELFLNDNKLTGNIPQSFTNLTTLEQFWLSNNGFSGSIPSFLSNLINLKFLYLTNNYFSGAIPTSFCNMPNLQKLGLTDNFLNGAIPNCLGNMLSLQELWLGSNYLSGNIPQNLLTKPNLRMSITNNFFNCNQVNAFVTNNQFASTKPIYYAPQNYRPLNYDNISSQVFETSSPATLMADLPWATTETVSYQWYRNGTLIPNATSATHFINAVQPSNVGRYTLHLKITDCPLGFAEVEFVSNPIYVILEGYDENGQQIEYNQIMVEFNSPESTSVYETAILQGKGWVKEQCNCNRELYLWQFQTTEKATEALVAIDRKIETVKDNDKSVIDGGFNNLIELNAPNRGNVAYDVLSNLTGNYPDEVTIFLLDTGLDETGINATPYLIQNAPVDNCYNVNPASGYNYTNTTLNNNYEDNVWHGNFGFTAITGVLNQSNNINIVPLKVFNELGKGNLFDLTCAVYHAIDHNADIINISAGFKGQSSAILNNAINLARKQGVFICAAAGNDALNIDVSPQFPASYAGQYQLFYDDNGIDVIDSVRYDNVISVASINADNVWSNFSNYGPNSVTISAYGENIHSYGLGGNDVVASGTSMATYFVTRELALEISKNKNRSYQQIWSEFYNNSLIPNNSTLGKTRTGRCLDVPVQVASIGGCIDQNSCNYFEFATYNDGSCNEPCGYDCISSINLQQVVSGGVYSAVQTLECNAPILLNSSVKFYAGQVISLNSGFSTKQSQSFSAIIENCSN